MSAGGNPASTHGGRRAGRMWIGALAAVAVIAAVLTGTVGRAAAAGSAATPATTIAGQASAARARLATTMAEPHTSAPTLAHPAADHAGGSALPAASPGAVRPAATSNTENGIDVYSGSGTVNWAAQAATGVSFAYVKATENTNYASSAFSQQYQGAAAAGLVRGAYHYAIPSASSGAAQADWFVANGGGWTADGMTLPGALDIESGSSENLPECYGLTQSAMVNWVGNFVSEYNRLVGRPPVIYTGYYFWQDCTGGSSAFGSTDPLWFPRYGATQAAPVAPGWSTYVIWQYAPGSTSAGTYDQDQFAGSASDLVAFAKNTSAVSSVCVGTLGHEAGGRPNTVGIASTPDGGGYWVVDSKGGVAACGDAVFQGSPTTLAKPIVGIAAGPDDASYYLVAADGGIFTYGNAQFQGSAGNIALAKPIVGMATNAAHNGYWLVASDGGIFTYNVPFFGSAGNIALTRPIVGMAPDPATGGYWLDASDGGIFSYNAPFLGSAGNLRLAKPVVGMASVASGQGYWLVASDGGIFNYNAPFYGSAGNVPLARPIIGMASPPGQPGYWLGAADGGIFNYAAPFEGSAA